VRECLLRMLHTMTSLYTKYLIRTDLSICTQSSAAISTAQPAPQCILSLPIQSGLYPYYSYNVHGIWCTRNFALHVNSNTFYKHFLALLVSQSTFHYPPQIYNTLIFVPVNEAEGQERPFSWIGQIGERKETQ
jgi:hypothetical protein